MLEGLVIFLILNFLLEVIKNKFNGYALFLVFYSFFRFHLDFLGNQTHIGFIINNISMGQILTLQCLLLEYFLRNEKTLKS